MMTDTEKKAERDKLFGMFTDEKTTIEDLFKYMEEFVNTHSDDDLYQGSPFYSTKYTPLDRMIGCLMYDEGRYLGKYKQLRWSDTSNGPYPQNVDRAPDDAINWYKNAPNTGIQKQEWPLKKATQIILGKLTNSGDLRFWEEVLGLSPAPTATPAPATPSKPPESAEGIISDAIENSRTRKKCIVFTGAPGTGKTYCVEEYVKDKMAGFDRKEYFVQFHSSYSYTDFMEGLRPVQKKDKMTFVCMDGIFKAFCRKVVELNEANHNGGKNAGASQIDSQEKEDTAARGDAPERDETEDGAAGENALKSGKKPDYYYFIIDEINRADLGQVFGELMYCFEKRGKDHKIATPNANLPAYGKDGKRIKKDCFQDGFYIPDNVIIIGTMNDIDRSVETFDFALRRRFDWVEIKAGDVMESSLRAMMEHLLEEEKKTEEAKVRSFVDALLRAVLPGITKMNKIIEKKSVLGEEYKIGHAYFKDYDAETGFKLYDEKSGLNQKNHTENLNTIWEHNIGPILREYMRGRQKADEFVIECGVALGVLPPSKETPKTDSPQGSGDGAAPQPGVSE